MGRRGLRPIDSSIDLSRHLYPLEELERFEPSEIFGREAPLEVEVGSGKGMFLLRASAEHPERDFIGIELAANYARFAASRLAKRDRTNAVVVSGDALKFFSEFLPENSADAVHVYFPDPWWKARHRKRRVMVPPFLKSIERVLKPGGELQFWTDVQEYFQESLELLAEHTKLDGPHPVPEREPAHDMDYRTNFERRVRQAGKPVYRAQFLKREG